MSFNYKFYLFLIPHFDCRIQKTFLFHFLISFSFIFCSNEGGNSDTAMVQAVPGPHGGATPLHVDDIPEPGVCWGTGPSPSEYFKLGAVSFFHGIEI